MENDNNNMDMQNETTNPQIINPVDAESVDGNTEYIARLEFRSFGVDPHVRPTFLYSHKFSDDYDGEFPSSYLIMRDMAIMLQMALNTKGSGLTPGRKQEQDFDPDLAESTLNQVEEDRGTNH